MTATIKIDSGQIDGIINRWNRDPSYVIEMLQDVQGIYRHLPQAALRQIGQATGTDMGRLHHIATFYKAFSLEPRGQTSVQVCMGTACHVRGASRLLEALGRELDVEPGGTTKDLRYTLEGVRCLGCCSLAPVVALDDKLISHVDSSQAAKIMRKHGRRED